MLWNPVTRYVATKLNQLSTHIPPPPRGANDIGKRRILLIHAHPREDSFSAALAAAVVEGAGEGGHEIRRRALVGLRVHADVEIVHVWCVYMCKCI